MFDLVSFVTGFAASIGAVSLNAFLQHGFTNQRDREKSKRDHAREQLNDFYGPLLSMLAELQIRKQVFFQLREYAVELNTEFKSIGALEKAAEYTEQLNYLRSQELLRYQKEDLPILTEIVALFRRKYWLSEPSTLEHLQALITLLEIWYMRSDNRPDWAIIEKAIHEESFFKELQTDLKRNKETLLQICQGEKPEEAKQHISKTTVSVHLMDGLPMKKDLATHTNVLPRKA